MSSKLNRAGTKAYMTIEMIDELLADAKERMQKSADATRNELATVRTGRASPHLLDRLNVDYYGAQTPLQQRRRWRRPMHEC